MAAEVPTFADDVLTGAAEIGKFIGKDERAALHLLYSGQLPGYKLGGIWHLRVSRYLEYVAELENANLARG